MKNYMGKAEDAKKECLEKMMNTVEYFEYGSTKQKIAGVLHDELRYTLQDINDPEEYFINLNNIFETFEDLMNEYKRKIDEIEEENEEEE